MLAKMQNPAANAPVPKETNHFLPFVMTDTPEVYGFREG
jgi:hypothetical protein